MVRRSAFRWILAAAALFGLGVRSAPAAAINFTGFVANDFNPSDKSVVVIPVDPDPTNRIFQLSEMTQKGIINGYAIKDMRLSYDSKTDNLYVGLNTYSIAGTAIGNGGPEIANLITQKGGVDPAHIGGRKSITVGFAGINPADQSQPGAVVAVAGVPQDKSTGGPGIDGFTVAKFKGMATQGIQNNYGQTLTNNLGALAFDPSAAHPGFEFTIKNFSKISPSLDPTRGFWVQAYAGSPEDNPIGEESTSFFNVPAFSPEKVVPEPTTWLAWTLVAGAAAVRVRRRGKR
jgi:hypothetical protein